MILAVSVLLKGIDVKKELFVFEEAYKQYKLCSRANLDARLKKEQAPYAKKYVNNALYAHVEAKTTLENFVEYVLKINELKEDLAMFTRLNNHRHVELLRPFIESIEEQAYLVPIVIDALRNLC